MRCPKCKHTEHAVLETRTTGEFFRRRRRCTSCGYRFSTVESVVGVHAANTELTPEDKKSIRMVFDRIVTLLGIPPGK